ncbi:MAG: NTP transferase domain-containing protein [Candidatus Magasanikbacteria bacterium]|jgi:mannose-1-phosphate guanylyltransferase/mannose-6-phosphate isomerase|nr:NTP transferase domain-containing protein [Candidatus Magasanikbacteria bacterium]
MNIIIFAGGAGTRLWPLSRTASPKQFAPLFGEQSTLQLAVDRVKSFGMENVYISTNEQYVPIIREQVSELDSSHILTEPAKRDLAAAVCLTLVRLKQQGVSGPTAILWSDHVMERPEAFEAALKKAEGLISQQSDRFVFLAESPRFANEQLGWIHVNGEIESDVYSFKQWKYKPEQEMCSQMFKSGEWFWNPGYFVFDIDFVLGLYEKHQSEMLASVQEMVTDWENKKHAYKELPALSFDNAIVEKVDPSQAVVVKVDLGWSDPGTLYALKEATVGSGPENYTQGTVVVQDCKDSFIYNEEKKVVTAIGMEGVIVVNTKDAVLVVKKEDVGSIKELLETLDQQGHSAVL